MNVFDVFVTPVNGISAVMCWITPEHAQELLERNTHNRRISPSVVKKYVSEMRLNEWYPTAAGIGFDTNGVLTDGQQRLTAVVEFGLPVPLLVVTGLSPRSQMKQDRQRKRTLSDVFFLSGVCDNAPIVQTAYFLASMGRAGPASDAEVELYLNAHEKALKDTHAVFRDRKKGLNQVGFRAAIVTAYLEHGSKAIDFAILVKSSIHQHLDDPALRLRRVLLGETVTRKHPSGVGGGQQMWAFRKTLYAFNAWISGERIKSVHEAEFVIPGNT